MKNAITVIDNELIDFIDEQVELGHYDRFVVEINQMAKDLIEINAELTKREQRYKGAIKDLINDIRNSDNSRCNEVINSHLFCGLNELLKGDSDE